MPMREYVKIPGIVTIYSSEVGDALAVDLSEWNCQYEYLSKELMTQTVQLRRL